MSVTSRLARTKQQIRGDWSRPRLSVTISNAHVYAQIIDDRVGHTLAFSSSSAAGITGSMTEKAQWVGSDIAQKAREAGVSQIIFDRRSRKFHGRVAALAQAAREHGLEF
ncbi:50S ribosomal protein L18 [Candidatus Saccharibacteria bacterium QS_5_54_17]|nr:MAG: 50S ribosomal protein L18 [Candidatus Saccharibacteria bacterium QS_5_54_17]